MTDRPVRPHPDRHRILADRGGVLMLAVVVAIGGAVSVIMRALTA